jgi:hypothetical protein
MEDMCLLGTFPPTPFTVRESTHLTKLSYETQQPVPQGKIHETVQLQTYFETSCEGATTAEPSPPGCMMVWGRRLLALRNKYDLSTPSGWSHPSLVRLTDWFSILTSPSYIRLFPQRMLPEIGYAVAPPTIRSNTTYVMIFH